MNKLTCLLLVLAATFAGRQSAKGFVTDYNNAWPGTDEGEDCLGSADTNAPRFAVCLVKASVHSEYTVSGLVEDNVYEGLWATGGRAVVITNYGAWQVGGESGVTQGDLGSSWLASGFLYQCGEYVSWPDFAVLREDVNAYLSNGAPVTLGAEVTESHDGSSFSVEVTYSTDEGLTQYYKISREYDGAVLPTRNLRQGRDDDPCGPGCADCAGHGMPVWHISEPYLNLWVHDTPMFYRTSLGRELGFTLSYKQRDTRPADEVAAPGTGWSHNWDSHVHFDVPVVGTVDGGNPNNAVAWLSHRGVRVCYNWVLSTNWQDWEAILYGLDNSESYYNSASRDDPQNQRSLVPVYDSQTNLTGFRVVHGDGSQDVYGLLTGGQRVYGIVERYGCLFDKNGLTNGPTGHWHPRLTGADTLHEDWQDGDDAATYTSTNVTANASFIQQLDYSDDPSLVEYVAFDALLTTRLDPWGNAITLGYDVSNRLDHITDYDNRTTQISYDTNGYLRSVAMPPSRMASFVFDGAGNLLSLTDAQGMTSTMDYLSAEGGQMVRLASLTTPYGLTRFEYYDDPPYVYVHRPGYWLGGRLQWLEDTRLFPVYVGEQSVNHTIIVTLPATPGDLYPTKELYFYCGATNNSQVPSSVPVSPAVAGEMGAVGGAVDSGGEGDGSLLSRNVFHWNRSQTELLSLTVSTNMMLTNLSVADFLKGEWQHYPVMVADDATANVDVGPAPTLVREASPDGAQAGNVTWFSYPGQLGDGQSWQLAGEGLDWVQVTEAPDGAALPTSFSYYSDSGLLWEVAEPYSVPNGSVDQRRYDWHYAFLAVTEPDGTTWSLPALSSVVGPSGALLSLNAPQTRQVNGTTVLDWPVLQATNAVGDASSYFFNDRHQLAGLQYANGATRTNLYAGPWLQKSILLEAGATTSLVFQDGELASGTTPLGLTLSFTHDLLGRLTSVGFPDGTTVLNVWDKRDLVAQKDRLGHWNYAGYDALDQLRGETNRNGGVTTFSYCDCGGLSSVTDPQGNATYFNRDNLGRKIGQTSATGSVAIERDNLGRPFHVSSSWGEEYWLAHNYQGRLVGLTNPAGTVFAAAFDINDFPLSVTDASGVSVTSQFDGLGRVLNRRDALNRLLEGNTYSPQGLSQRMDNLGHATAFAYDSAGRLSAMTNANLEVSRFGYGPSGDLVSLTDGRSHTKGWAYDIYGRQIAETNANGVLVRTNGYDANSRLTAQWTAAKDLTTADYDNRGNVLAIHYPHSTVGYTYDLLDRLVTMSDGLGSHSFGYANLGAFDWAPGSESGPFGTLSRTYSGPLLASIGIGSWSETIGRDSARRPQTVNDTQAGAFSYAFNGAGRQLHSLAGPGSTTTYGYDLAGELTLMGVTNSLGTALDYHAYDYNEVGLIKTAYRLSGSIVNYAYDNLGQLISSQAFEPDSTPRLNEDQGWGYDASGNLQWRTNHTLIQQFTSDAANQLASVVRSGALTVSGSLTGAVTKLGVNGTQAQIYSDGTFATSNGLTLRDGNNLFVTAGSNAAGQLVLSTITSNRLPVSVNFAYDRNGNLLSDSQRTFAYDDANQLTNVTVPGQWKTDFVYDGLGRRRIVRDSTWLPAIGNWQVTNEVHYVCDGMLPIQERDSNNAVRVTYTRGLDLSGSFQRAGGIGGLLGRTDGSGSAFYHGDAGGNITSLTDSSGSSVASYLLDPFGRTLGMSGPLARPNVIRFSSMPYYEQSGIVGYPLRPYIPMLQRWASEDPIREGGGINLPQFVRNNPLSYVDPYGEDFHVVGAGGLLAPGPLGYLSGDTALEQLAAGGYNAFPEVGNIVANVATGIGQVVEGAVDLSKWLTQELGGSPADEQLVGAAVGAASLLIGGPEAQLGKVSCAAEETTTLYRAVSHAEYADLTANGVFRAGPNSYEFGKFFAETGEHAAQWGTKLEGAGNFRVIEAQFPTSTANQFTR